MINGRAEKAWSCQIRRDTSSGYGTTAGSASKTRVRRLSRSYAGQPRYELSHRATMRFDTTAHVVDDPRPWERARWEGVR